MTNEMTMFTGMQRQTLVRSMDYVNSINVFRRDGDLPNLLSGGTESSVLPGRVQMVLGRRRWVLTLTHDERERHPHLVTSLADGGQIR